jgi:hypothetical protein
VQTTRSRASERQPGGRSLAIALIALVVAVISLIVSLTAT